MAEDRSYIEENTRERERIAPWSSARARTTFALQSTPIGRWRRCSATSRSGTRGCCRSPTSSSEARRSPRPTPSRRTSLDQRRGRALIHAIPPARSPASRSRSPRRPTRGSRPYPSIASGLATRRARCTHSARRTGATPRRRRVGAPELDRHHDLPSDVPRADRCERFTCILQRVRTDLRGHDLASREHGGRDRRAQSSSLDPGRSSPGRLSRRGLRRRQHRRWMPRGLRTRRAR